MPRQTRHQLLAADKENNPNNQLRTMIRQRCIFANFNRNRHRPRNRCLEKREAISKVDGLHMFGSHVIGGAILKLHYMAQIAVDTLHESQIEPILH